MPPKRNAQRGKVKRTDEMVSALIKCRDRAKELSGGNNPPLNESGRKLGYMQLMHSLFLEKYPELVYLTPQNLRDKVAQAEKINNVQNLQSPLTETFNLDVNINVVNAEDIERNVVVNHGDVNYIFTPLNAKECKAFDIAKDLLKDISLTKGEMCNRLWKTRIISIPKPNDILTVNKLVKYLLSDIGQIKQGLYFEALWNLNCIIYAAIIGWYRVNNFKCTITNLTGKVQPRSYKWLDEINAEIMGTRKFISQSVAELERIKVSGRLTRKTKRNRKAIESRIGKLSCYSLTKFVMKLKARLRRLSITRKRKIKNQERKDYNNKFSRNQGKVFSEFKDVINDQSDNKFPIFNKVIKARKYFENSEDVLMFWKSLWEKEDIGNPNAAWLEDYRSLFQSIIPEINTADIEISESMIWNAIKKKRNWSAPGPDLVVNFWLKKLFVIHDSVRQIFRGIINSEADIEKWFTRGRTGILEKDENFVYDNTRPITCTNNIYKWFSSVLLEIYNSHANRYNIMQRDQRGAKSGCSGTFQNLLIDDMVLKDAHDNARNMCSGWVDVRKAFDSVSHKWIEEMLRIHRFPLKLTSVICKVMNAWNIRLVIPLAEGDVISDPINIKSGVLQGDVICPNLYTLCKNPISWELRRFEGYRLSKPLNSKITHLLFIDDLRVYSKSRKEHKKVMSHAKRIMLDGGLEWNMKKTKILNMKRGKVDISEGDMVLDDESVVKSLESEDLYKFLGVLENEKHDTEGLVKGIKAKVTKRASVVWSSPLSDYNKIQATNIFVLSCLGYFFWTEKFNITDLREIDANIREVMNMQKAKYKLQANCSLYLPRSRGGRGLKQAESIYKVTRIKAAMKLLTDEDPEMILVKEFDKQRMAKNRSSVIKDAVRYSKDDFKVEFTPHESNFTLMYGDSECRKSTSEIHVASKVLKDATIKNFEEEMDKLTWQGETFKQRKSDSELKMSECFEWCKNWNNCPVEVINDIQSIYLQIIPTLTFQKHRGHSEITNTVCRLCHEGIENVQHLLSGCGYFVKFYYMRRHNRVLQYIYFNLLVKYSLAESCPPWYSKAVVKPMYENEEICLLWDIPEYLGHDDEDDSKTMRPDGKMIMKQKLQVVVLEMSVPWIANRERKYVEKNVKYVEIMCSMKTLYPNFEIKQVTFIIDCLGGYSSSLIDSLKEIGFNKIEYERMIRNIQKIVLSESRNIINKFKQLTSK